jgi:hypothetical protein
MSFGDSGGDFKGATMVKTLSIRAGETLAEAAARCGVDESLMIEVWHDDKHRPNDGAMAQNAADGFIHSLDWNLGEVDYPSGDE